MIMLFENMKLITASMADILVQFEIGIYNYICVISLLLIAVYVLVFEKVGWRIVTILTLGMMLFVNISFDYRMMYIMIPLMLFIVSKEKIKDRRNVFYAVLFGLMLIPKSYYIVKFSYTTPSIGGIINPLLYIVMIVSLMKDGLKGKKVLVSIKKYIADLFVDFKNRKQPDRS